MFFWRKKNEGFEWREYVRTTILVRRQERRQKIHDAKDAAVFGVKNAGRSGIQLLIDGAIRAAEASALFAVSAFDVLRRILQSGLSVVWNGLLAILTAVGQGLAAVMRGLAQILAPVFGRVGAGAAQILAPLLDYLSRRRVQRALLISGLLAAGLAVGRSVLVVLDWEAGIAAVISAGLLLLVILPRMTEWDWRSPVSSFARICQEWWLKIWGLASRISPRTATAAVLLGLGAVGAGYLLPPLDVSKSPIETSSIDRDDARVFDGRMTALSGDILQAGGSILRLSGVEAPERDQTCARADGRTWRCGASAREALSRLLRSDRTTCTLTGEVSDEIPLATCTAGGRDVAEDLVRDGHVFAVTSIFSGYGSIEDEAREARRGIWFGEALRPTEYRTQRWEEAKRTAPDGCPIKGQVSGQERTYVLPWSAAYERVKIRPARGERWFCSEEEARAAGWRLASRS